VCVRGNLHTTNTVQTATTTTATAFTAFVFSLTDQLQVLERKTFSISKADAFPLTQPTSSKHRR